MSKKVYLLEDSDKEFTVGFWCGGCRCDHEIRTRVTDPSRPKWTWNNDWEKPTATPSIDYFRDDPSKRCHFFIIDGVINYLGDCFHQFKGQKIPMEDVED